MEKAKQDGYITHRSTHEINHASTFMIIRIKHNPTIFAVELSNMDRATQDGYITHRSTHETNHASTFMIIRIKHNPTIFAVELWTWRELHKMVTSHTDQHTKTIMHQPSWSYASSITQPSWHWSYKHGKSYTRWLHHTPINTWKQSCINLHDHTHQA